MLTLVSTSRSAPKHLTLPRPSETVPPDSSALPKILLSKELPPGGKHFKRPVGKGVACVAWKRDGGICLALLSEHHKSCDDPTVGSLRNNFARCVKPLTERLESLSRRLHQRCTARFGRAFVLCCVPAHLAGSGTYCPARRKNAWATVMNRTPICRFPTGLFLQHTTNITPVALSQLRHIREV